MPSKYWVVADSANFEAQGLDTLGEETAQGEYIYPVWVHYYEKPPRGKENHTGRYLESGVRYFKKVKKK